MFEEFQNIDLVQVSVYSVLTNLGVALVCGLIIAIVYRFIYRGPSYLTTYVNSLVLLAMITSLVIMVIGNNLARAFGLVGAMSIIRFRTAVRDVQDIVFIFFALAAGMASGVGLHAVAIAGSILICLVAVVLVTFNFGNPAKTEYVLQLKYPPTSQSETIISEILKKFCRHVKLVNLKNQAENGDMEAFYQFSFRRRYTGTDIVQALTSHSDIIKFSLYFDEDEANAPF